MIRHVILSGSFFDVGVKKLATAVSKDWGSSVVLLETDQTTYSW